jgi:hypothetical protein
LLELLAACADPSTAPALSALVEGHALPTGERAWAALAVGESGGAEAAEHLARALSGLRRGEQLVAAACLIAIARTGGPEALLAALAFVPERERERLFVLATSDSASGAAATAHFKLARELEPFLLPAFASSIRRSTP